MGRSSYSCSRGMTLRSGGRNEDQKDYTENQGREVDEVGEVFARQSVPGDVEDGGNFEG